MLLSELSSLLFVLLCVRQMLCLSLIFLLMFLRQWLLFHEASLVFLQWLLSVVMAVLFPELSLMFVLLCIRQMLCLSLIFLLMFL